MPLNAKNTKTQLFGNTALVNHISKLTSAVFVSYFVLFKSVYLFRHAQIKG
jgi:hypothetical protein